MLGVENVSPLNGKNELPDAWLSQCSVLILMLASDLIQFVMTQESLCSMEGNKRNEKPNSQGVFFNEAIVHSYYRKMLP